MGTMIIIIAQTIVINVILLANNAIPMNNVVPVL